MMAWGPEGQCPPPLDDDDARRLEARAVHDLEVDGELAAVVVEDLDADAAAAGLKGARETSPEVGLVNDGQALLDITGLGHGGDSAVLEIQDAVLLEDGAKHGLDDDRGRRVGHEGGLLVQLLGEEVDTEVAVLAGGSRGRDLDDLAGAALEHQDVAEADVVAWDGDRVGGVRTLGHGAGAARLADLAHADALAVVVMAFGVNQAVSELVQTVAEGVVVT